MGRHRTGRKHDLTGRFQYGFSLIEVIMAVTILGLVIMFIFNLYPSSVLAIRHAEHRLRAVNLAQSILEEKRSGPFSALAAATDLKDVTGDDGVIYHPVYEPFIVLGADPNRLRGIRVTVTWTAQEKQYAISQEAYVCNIQR
jgi:prepilin-type N-terminal cleavage/methylation domain-containing protein